MQLVLKEYHYGQKSDAIMDPNNRLKALDVTKVLMGIMSSRDNVKRFAYDERMWAKRQDYSYEDILKVAEVTV